MGSAVAPVHAYTQANPMSTTSGSGAPAAGASTISANDFLTLLVTEMKNQDPTAQTDPNEYINQLVQVNSLEQLIQINQNLTTALGGTDTDGSGSASGQAVKGSAIVATSGQTEQTTGDTRRALVPDPRERPAMAGNLGVPQPIPAAQRLAQALSGR